jgi:hypothetical protein
MASALSTAAISTIPAGQVAAAEHSDQTEAETTDPPQVDGVTISPTPIPVTPFTDIDEDLNEALVGIQPGEVPDVDSELYWGAVPVPKATLDQKWVKVGWEGQHMAISDSKINPDGSVTVSGHVRSGVFFHASLDTVLKSVRSVVQRSLGVDIPLDKSRMKVGATYLDGDEMVSIVTISMEPESAIEHGAMGTRPDQENPTGLNVGDTIRPMGG